MKFNQKIIKDIKKVKMLRNIKVKVTADKEKLRFTIPAKEIRMIKAKPKDYVKVNTKKGEYTFGYYVSIPSMPPSRTNLQVKRSVPKDFVKKTNLKAGDIIGISISLVENKRSTELIRDNKLDILAAIPEKTKSGKTIMMDLFKKNNEEYCRVWYCSGQGGNAKPIELKRYIEIDRRLGEFFGLMQAESRKNGHKFDFTNNLISEHKLFMEVAERFGISKDIWKYQVFYNPSMPKESIEAEVLAFKENLGIAKKLIFTKNKLLTKVALTVYIDCNVLSEVMISLMLMLRSRVTHSIETKELREFAIGFICKDLLGDGTVVYNKANGKIEVVISEQDLDSQTEISKILNNFGIRTNIIKNKIYLQTSINIYLWFIENKAFEGHNNRNKLIKAILNNYYIKSIRNRLKENMSYTASEFAKEHNLFLSTAQKYLRENTIRGFLKCDKEKKSNVYILSNKGQNVTRIIKNAEKELLSF